MSTVRERLRRSTVILGVPGLAGTGITQAEKTSINTRLSDAEAEIVTIPDQIATAIANEPTVVDAARAAAGAAVASEIAGRDLIEMGRQVVRGKNLFVYPAITKGYTLNTDGTLVANASYDTSEFIPVRGGAEYTFSSGRGDQMGPRTLVFYDVHHAFVQYLDNTSAMPPTTRTPAQDGFVRASYRSTVSPIAQVERGQYATTYEPPILTIPSLGNVEIPLIGREVQTGKNLFNPGTAIPDVYVDHNSGRDVAFAGYIASAMIPVARSQSYTISYARHVAFYDLWGRFVQGHNLTAGTHTLVAPEDGYLRFSFPISGRDPASVQVEAGASATEIEPYRLVIPDLRLTEAQRAGTDAGQVEALIAGDTLTLTSGLGAAGTLTIETALHGSANGAFNFVRDALNGTMIHGTGDDITPIRTFATVGANHGYTTISRYTAAGHGKGAADLGSIYTDGARQYTLLRIDGDDLTFGHPYASSGGVVTGSGTAPVATLAYVSGGPNTGDVPTTTRLAGSQLYPSTGNVDVRVLVDGAPVSGDGAYGGETVQVVESYTIHDYGALIDWARANIGQSFADHRDEIAGVVRITNIYTFLPGGRCTVAATLTALRPVALGNCGFLQSTALSATGLTTHRYIPGVAAKGGYDFGQLVDLTAYNANLLFGPADYLDAGEPPSRYVDWLVNGSGQKVVGFTMGYLTDKTNSRDADRAILATAWDMRSTKKSYPVAISGVTLQPGDSRSIEGFRNYLAPHSSGATIVNTVPDASGTYVHLDFHAPVTAAPVALPEDIGRSVAVLAASSLTAASDTVTAEGLTVTVAGSAGRAVLRLD